MKNLTQYPFTPHFFTRNNHELAYLDEGEGPVLVMVHGNPTWSYMYRNLVSGLKNRYRCIVPDHLGCGFSDKPHNGVYRLAEHIANLEALLEHLEVERCVMIVHDWGGAIGMGWATRHPERVLATVVMNTAAFPSTRMPLRIAACRWPVLGALMVRGLNGFARAATLMAVHKQPMRPEIAKGFLAPYDSWEHRIAVHRFVQDVPMQPDHPSRQTLEELAASLDNLRGKPMLICWGGQDFCFNEEFLNEWQRRFPEAQTHIFPEAGHYLLEDEGEAILPIIGDFLDQHGE